MDRLNPERLYAAIDLLQHKATRLDHLDQQDVKEILLVAGIYEKEVEVIGCLQQK